MRGYNIIIELGGSNPLVCRDLIIPENFTFKKLHDCIQIIFGLNDFENYHMYEFSFKNSEIKITDFSTDRLIIPSNTIIDSNTTFINYYFKNNNFIYYEYDFGNSTYLIIEVKEIVDYDKYYPVIKGFKGAYNLTEDFNICILNELNSYEDSQNAIVNDNQFKFVDDRKILDPQFKPFLKEFKKFDINKANKRLINFFKK